MKAQVLSTRYVVREGGRKIVHRAGAIVEVTKAEFERGKGKFLRAHSEASTPLPASNASAVDPRATQPDGTPLDGVVKGKPPVDLEAYVPAKSQVEADERATARGITFPAKTSLKDKNAALKEMHDTEQAAAADDPDAAPVLDDLSEKSDEELIQLAIDAGHAESEMVEMGHDELVTFVAAAVNRRSQDPAAQAEALASSSADDSSQE